jgi:hypothetical protein
MSTKKANRRKTKAPRVAVIATATEEPSVLGQAALLLTLGARTIFSLSADEVEIRAVVQAARRNVERYIRDKDEVDDDRAFQALGLLIVLDSALADGLDMEATDLVDPLLTSLEAVQRLLDEAALAAQELLDETARAAQESGEAVAGKAA